MSQIEAKKIGECEICPKTDVEITLRYGNMWFCDECWATEVKTTSENMSPENQAARVNEVNSRNSERLAAKANEIIRNDDNSIEVRSDLFNAATQAIIDMKKAIDEREENKNYVLAEQLKNRFEHFKKVIFDAQELIVSAGNEQKAIQVYLNNLANSLRQEEREKLRIQDINYKPAPVKTPSVRNVKTTQAGVGKKKVSKQEITAAAKELGIAEFTLHAFVLQNGGDLQLAVSKLKAAIEAGKSKTQSN